MQRPNILYLHSHDTGRYIQPYGYAVPTPNLQRFAEEGVLFRQCFCAGPTCSASRAAMLTGQDCHSSGMIGLAHLGFGLHDYSQHILHTLRKVGYESTLCGVQHVAHHRDPDSWKKIGYDRTLEIRDRYTETIAGQARQFLTDAPKEPFFLSVGFFDTHRKFQRHDPCDDPRYVRPPAPLPDTPRTRRDMADFISSARRLDAGMGGVLAALEEAGLAENTLVICTTDHGIAFPFMKCNLTDHGTGVMLMMRGPGGLAGGKVIDAMVSHVDVFPTVCDLLGIDRPDWLTGKSMLPLVRGDADEINEEVYSEVTYHAAYEPQRAVRTKRYKYIRRFDGREAPVMPNCDDGFSKSEMLDAGWRRRPPAEEALYDLMFDPNEACNIAGCDGAAEVVADMRRRLDDWMKRTDDPILKGLPVPAPEGARAADPDGLHPGDKGKVQK